MDNVNVKFKKLTPTAIVPEYKSAEAAGMDLYADEDVILKSQFQKIDNTNDVRFVTENRHRLISTGIAVELPVGYEAQVRPRSGLALKHGVTVLNSPGTVDSDYRLGIGIILINHGFEDFEIRKGDRIAQLIIAPVSRAQMVEVKELNESERIGGFGSTGK